MKVTIELVLEADTASEEAIKEAVYRYLIELIEDDSLEYDINNE